MKQVAEHIYKTDVLIASMMLKIQQLEEKSHAPREFVKCEDCKCKIKEDE